MRYTGFHLWVTNSKLTKVNSNQKSLAFNDLSLPCEEEASDLSTLQKNHHYNQHSHAACFKVEVGSDDYRQTELPILQTDLTSVDKPFTNFNLAHKPLFSMVKLIQE